MRPAPRPGSFVQMLLRAVSRWLQPAPALVPVRVRTGQPPRRAPLRIPHDRG